MKISDNHYLYRLETQNEDGSIVDFQEVETVEPLRSVGDIHDELDLENNKQIKRIEEIVFTGDSSEYWYNDDVHTTDTHFVAYMENIDLYCHTEHHLCETDRNLFEFGDVHVDENKNFFCTSVESNGMNRIYISIAKSELAYTVYSHETLKEYFKDNPTTVWYVLRYPIEIPRLNAKGYVITHDGSTTIDVQPQTTGKVIPIVKATIEDTVIEMDSVPTMTINNTDEGNQITDLTFEGVTLVNNAKADNIKGTKEVSHTRYDFAPFYDGQTTINNTIEGGYVSAKLYGDTMINIAKTYGETPLLTATSESALCDDLLGTNEEGIVLADGEITEGRIYGDSIKTPYLNVLYKEGTINEQTGEITNPNIGCHSEKMPIPNRTFIFTTPYPYSKVIYFDSNDTIIKYDWSDSQVKPVTSTPPENASYLIFGIDNKGGSTEKITYVYEDNGEAVEEFFAYEIQSVVNPTIISNGVFKYGSLDVINGGVVKDSQEQMCTDFLDVPIRSFCFDTKNSWARLAFYNENKEFISYAQTGNSNYAKLYVSTSSIPSDAKYIRYGFSGEFLKVTTIKYTDDNTDVYSNLKLTQATLPYELNKLPNGVVDYIDVVNGVYVQRVGKIVLDGSENWVLSAYENSRQFYIPLNNLVRKVDYLNSMSCDKFVVYAEEKALSDSISPNGISAYADWIHEYPNENWLYIKYANSEGSIEKLKTYLASNPTTVIYELATPIYTPLTEEEKASLPLSAYANGYIQLSSDELRPSKFEFRAKSNNRMQLDMLETGHYYLNASIGNVKLGDVDIDVTEMPCIINVSNANNKRLISDGIGHNITIPQSDMVDGGYFDSADGAFATNQGMCYSPIYYEILPNVLYGLFGGLNMRIHFYDEAQTFIRTVDSPDTSWTYFTTPSKAKYLRFSYNKYYKKDYVLISNPITLSKLPSHRIPTTFTQGMKSSVDFGYWQGMMSSIASRFTGRDNNGSYTEYISFNSLPNITESNSYGLTLRRITGKYGTTVTVEDEFDISTGKYTKRVGKYVIDGSVDPRLNNEFNFETNIIRVDFLGSKTGIKTKNQWGSYGLGITETLPSAVNFNLKTDPHIFVGDTAIYLFMRLDSFQGLDHESVKDYFRKNPMTVYYELETPEIIYVDLPQNTIHTSANRTIIETWKGGGGLFPQVKPSLLSYPTTLSPNTQYTVFHNRKNYNGSVKTPMINLGGTEASATGSRTVVTTPSTLAHNELQFIGGENTVEQVMVLYGDWTKQGKTVDYFEGLQSSVIGDKTLENLVDEPIEIWSSSVTDVSNGGAVDYVSIDDVVAGYGNRPKLPEVQVDTNIRTYGMTLQNLSYVKGEQLLQINGFVDNVSTLYKNSTTYTIMFYVKEATVPKLRIQEYYGGTYSGKSSNFDITNGNVKFVYTTSPSNKFDRLRIRNIDTASSEVTISDIIILEGDYTNIDIPFFEGMKSVENPVLTSIGKNLLEPNNISYVKNATVNIHIRNIIKANVDYVITFDNNGVDWKGRSFYLRNSSGGNVGYFAIYDNKGDGRSGVCFRFTEEQVYELNNGGYLQLYNADVPGIESRPFDFQIEENSIATEYEPYKSSILSTPQGTVLRGVGSYKDVIGWNDGIIRRNCVEFTISGEEGYSWAFSSEKEYTMLFGLGLTNLGLNGKLVGGSNAPVICDKIPYKNDSSDTVHLRPNGINPAGALQFWFDKSKLTNNTSQGINDYIKSIGGLTIVAPLANTEYEDVEITGGGNWKEFVSDETITNTDVLIFNHGTLYTTTDTHPSTFLDFSLKTTNRYTVKDFNKLKYTVLTEQPFYLNGVDYPASLTGMTIIDVTGIADSSIYSDDTMVTVVQDDGNYYADGVLTQFKGIKTFTKEFIRTGNDIYNTGMTLLEPLELCSGVTGVRDIYNPITGTLVKRFHTFVIDDEFLDKYSWNYQEDTANNMWEIYIPNTASRGILPEGKEGANGYATPPFHYNNWGNIERICMTDNLYIKTYVSNVPNKDVNLFLEYLKQYTPITVSYELETPQIIQATPTSTYISTRPENGNIVAQDIQIQAEYLNYDNEQSIISPRMLGDGDEIRWEQGSQCYVYENDNEYIPLTEYNELFGANLQAQEYTQYAESVDGADIEVGVALKEKAVYEQTYVKYEDNVVYPETMENIDETNGVEVDYICGATWQNPDDLSDIRHLGELREDGQYDVTIRRSGDDEIRLLEGTTYLGLDYDELPSSEFELTFFNSGGVEVGKYGDTTHVLEDCVENSKLASGTVYGQTLINLIDFKANSYQTAGSATSRGVNTITFKTNSTGKFNIGCTVDLKPSAKYCIKANIQSTNSVSFRVCDVKANYYPISETIPANGEYIGTFTASSYATTGQVTFYRGTTVGEETITGTVTLIEYIDGCENWLEHFEGINSTVVNGFSSCGKNLLNDATKQTGYINSQGQYLFDKANVLYDYVRIYPNTVYYGRSWGHINAVQISWYDVNKNFISRTTSGRGEPITTPNNAYYARVYAQYFESNQIDNDISQVQVMFSHEPITEYEPYKSTNYTLPTPITLRKVGDVCDTFDVVSGVYTQKICEIVLDGSENWVKQHYTTGYTMFSYIVPILPIDTTIRIGRMLCNNFNVENYINMQAQTREFITIRNGTTGQLLLNISNEKANEVTVLKEWLSQNPITVQYELATKSVTTVDLIPSTTQTTQEPTFILPQPLRSVPNGICDRLYWDENKGHYCIEKRVDVLNLDGTENWSTTNSQDNATTIFFQTYINSVFNTSRSADGETIYSDKFKYGYVDSTSNEEIRLNGNFLQIRINKNRLETLDVFGFKRWLRQNNTTLYYLPSASQIIDLLHLNRKLKLPTQPDIYPIGYKAVHEKVNPEIGLTIPYKQLNMPTQPVNLNFVMDIADYVLTWDDVKEARQYNIILNDEVIATVKEPQYNTGEEMYGYILVEANNEIGDSVSKELYIKTVPNAPAQLTVAHNPLTDYYDFEISFIDKSAIADYYTVQYRVDGGEWIINNIENDKLAIGDKKLWSFSVYEIKESIEVWATATNDVGTNDILPSAIYYMSPTPQWTYRMNSKEVFLRWMDNSPYDVKYKLRYSYLSNGQYQYAYFEGDKEEIGKLYEAVVPLAENDEVAIALCIVSEKENLYCKPVKASKELDPNIVPPLNFNYRWLARGLIEFYWQDQYDVDVEYEYILETVKGSESVWTQVNETITSTDVEGTGTVYRVEYQLEDLEQIRMKVRMKWAMNETQWTETLTTVFIPVEGNPPTYIRRTQTAEGLLVEWEAQAYIDSYHIYVIDNTTKEVLQHLETQDNNIIVDLDYSNSIELAIYEISRFSGGIESDPTDSMVFTPTMSEITMLQNIYQPCVEEHSIEVSTVQKESRQPYVIHDVSYTPNVESESDLQVNVSTPFIISYHPTEIDVHQVGSKAIADMDLKIKTLDTRTEETVEVMTFERITDTYDMNFQVYTPSVMSYPITLEVSKVRIVCLGDSLTSGHPFYWAETGTGDITASYPYQLSRRLKNQYEVINSGYGSDTTDRCLARFDRDVLRYFPQYCIFQCGTNDLYWAMAESLNNQEALDMKMQVVRENTMEVVKRCWDNGIIPIIGTLIPRTGATGIYKTALYEHNEWIISWCNEQSASGRDIFYVDFFNAGKDVVPPTPLEDPSNPGAMNPIYDGDRVYDAFGNLEKEGRGIHLNPEGYKIMASAVPLSIFQTYDTGLKMYRDAQCTFEDNYDDSDKLNSFYTIEVDNVRRSKTKTIIRYVKNIGRTQVLFAMYGTDMYNMTMEFIGTDGSRGQFANGLLAPDMVAKVTIEINLGDEDFKASFNMHLASREYSQS